MSRVVLALVALACIVAAVSASPAGARLAELESAFDATISSPIELVELSSTQLQSMDLAAVISTHTQAEEAAEATELAEANPWAQMDEAEQRAQVDASIEAVERAELESRPVTSEDSSLLQTSASAVSSRSYWSNASNRRQWCTNVRWGYGWIERHPHWQRVCKSIEKFRPWGWWSHMCHNIYSGNWGGWYRKNKWWRQQCKSIRNPHYKDTRNRPWAWHPGHQRNKYSKWCEQHGHKFRDLTNNHYNFFCHGREAPKGFKRGLWEVDTSASKAEQKNFWHCKKYRKYSATWKSQNMDKAFQARCSKGEGARGAKYPGFDPQMTHEQKRAVRKAAKRAAKKAKQHAARKWKWSPAIPRTRRSSWCERKGSKGKAWRRSQSDKFRGKWRKHCKGRRENHAEKKQRLRTVAKRARARVLARIPRKLSKPHREVKQFKAKKMARGHHLRRALAKKKLRQLRKKMTPEKKAALAARVQRAKAQLKTNLPAGVKPNQMAGLLKALKVAAVAPLPKKRHSARKASKPIVMPAAPVLPPRPATAPKLKELRRIARAVNHQRSRAARAAIRAKHGKASKHNTEYERGFAAALASAGGNHKLAKALKDAGFSAGQAVGAAVAANEAAAAAGGAKPGFTAAGTPIALAAETTPGAAKEAAAHNPAAAAAVAAAKEVGGVKGVDIKAADIAAAVKQAVGAVQGKQHKHAAHKPTKPKPFVSRVAAANAKAVAARKPEAEKKNPYGDDVESDDADKAAKANAKAKINRAKAKDQRKQNRKAGKKGKGKAQRKFTKGTNIDWKPKFRNTIKDNETVKKVKVEAVTPKDKVIAPVRRSTMRKKWPIELDPTSVAAIDLPLIEELHRRVDYLIEPQADVLSIAEPTLISARKQVLEAEDHHIRVHDFEIKHTNQLLVPQYIQDEQKIVQLD